ncbi:MAG: ATP-binding protein [Lachnospiraceae bacterium]|nr:ATP-binding protein [Lachnospiraceae bacterium]
MQNAKQNRANILELENILKKIGISLDREENEPIIEGYKKILGFIKEKLKPISNEVELQLESRKFIEVYERFYGKDEKKFIATDIQSLKNKKLYIEYLNFNFYAKELVRAEKQRQNIQQKISKLNEIIAELKNYEIALKEGIMEYKRKIISDIEPLLHIYTGKILQQKFNGKSIYIHTSKDVEDIQFVNSTTDNQDILYSMSSGQLSAVALAFLLCMNQVYGTHKACSILLIDDPVQTIDDVNMVGLVDILRYGFSDRQIFISTHEQSFEWFLRYRYFKADKSVKVFNMKDILL